MKGRAQRRHDTAKWKKKEHPASKCGNTRCPICSPYKAKWWGNSLQALKRKYWPTKEQQQEE